MTDRQYQGERCTVCGYTDIGSIYKHLMLTGHRGREQGKIMRVGWMGKWEFTPDAPAAPEADAPAAAPPRYRCAECDTVSTAAGVGSHHKASGHKGRVQV